MKKWVSVLWAIGLIVAQVLFAAPVQAQNAFVWDAAHYGVAPFSHAISFSGNSLSSSGLRQVQEFWSGSEGGEACEHLGIPSDYLDVVKQVVEDSSEACTVSVSDYSDVARTCWTRYRAEFKTYGAYKAVLLAGTMPAGYHKAMCWRSASRGIATRYHVLRKFEAQCVGVLILDSTTHKPVFIGQTARCGNPFYDVGGIYIHDVEIQVVEKAVPVEVEGPERVVEVPVDRVVTRTRTKVIEREREVPVLYDRLIIAPAPLSQTAVGYRPTPKRWISTRPGIGGAAIGLLETGVGALLPGSRTTYNIAGGSAWQKQGQSSRNNNRNTNKSKNRNDNNNANQNSNDVAASAAAGK